MSATDRRHRYRRTFVAAAALVPLACAARTDPSESRSNPCPSSRVTNYMAARAQQCWYVSDQGRWRITNHEFHYDVLVMETEASSLDLTTEIVRRIAGVHGERFVEMMIYVRREGTSPPMVRRARRVQSGTIDLLDFELSAP